MRPHASVSGPLAAVAVPALRRVPSPRARGRGAPGAPRRRVHGRDDPGGLRSGSRPWSRAPRAASPSRLTFVRAPGGVWRTPGRRGCRAPEPVTHPKSRRQWAQREGRPGHARGRDAGANLDRGRPLAFKTSRPASALSPGAMGQATALAGAGCSGVRGPVCQPEPRTCGCPLPPAGVVLRRVCGGLCVALPTGRGF